MSAIHSSTYERKSVQQREYTGVPVCCARTLQSLKLLFGCFGYIRRILCTSTSPNPAAPAALCVQCSIILTQFIFDIYFHLISQSLHEYFAFIFYRWSRQLTQATNLEASHRPTDTHRYHDVLVSTVIVPIVRRTTKTGKAHQVARRWDAKRRYLLAVPCFGSTGR